MKIFITRIIIIIELFSKIKIERKNKNKIIYQVDIDYYLTLNITEIALNKEDIQHIFNLSLN